MLRSLSFTTVALALGVLTTPASAAPGSNLKGIEAGTGTSVTEQVGYRRCWWRSGQRRCRWVDDGYSYGPSLDLVPRSLVGRDYVLNAHDACRPGHLHTHFPFPLSSSTRCPLVIVKESS